MKHTFDELLDVVYRYYPRGVGIVDGDLDVQAISDSEEHGRLVAARRKAATDERWHAMRRRIQEHFPDAPLMNHSLHLPTDSYDDACYSFEISPPGATAGRPLWFHISFLAPYYVIHGSRMVESDIVVPVRGFRFVFHGVQFFVPRNAAGPELILNLHDEGTESVTVKQRDVTVTFDLSPGERPYAEWIAREIETTFGCEPMPPEVGTVLVPDLATPKLPGEVRLYDCLFSKQHEWVNPSPSDRETSLDIDASRLTDRFIPVVTVLAALHLMTSTLTREAQALRLGMPVGVYLVVTTDGILHKEEVLKTLATIRSLMDSPLTPRGIAAKREFEAAARELEALTAAWDGDGTPPDAMVAWAKNFLTSWVVGEN